MYINHNTRVSHPRGFKLFPLVGTMSAFSTFSNIVDNGGSTTGPFPRSISHWKYQARSLLSKKAFVTSHAEGVQYPYSDSSLLDGL